MSNISLPECLACEIVTRKRKVVWLHSLHGGINPTPLKNTPPPHLSCQALLNLQTVQAPLFRQPPSIFVFCEPLSPKSQIFQWTTKILKFKSNKNLSYNSQFELLVMTEKKNFINFLSLNNWNNSDFSLFFMKKLQPPSPQKSHALFPSNPSLKVEVLSRPPPFLKIW